MLGVVLAATVLATTACSNSTGPAADGPGSYRYTVTLAGQQTTYTGHNAAFYRYAYSEQPGDSAIYLWVGDSLSFYQDTYAPTWLPPLSAEAVVGSYAGGPYWMLNGSTSPLPFYSSYLDASDSVTITSASLSSIQGTFHLTYLYRDDTIQVTGTFNAAPTDTFRSN